MPSPEKVAKVAELRERAARAAGMYLVEYQGLTVREISELRQQLRAAGALLVVVKNRLFKRALQETPGAALEQFLVGPTAVIFCDTDAIAPAKVVGEFARTHEVVRWKGGWVEGTVFDAEGMARVAELPPKAEIVASVVGGVAAPLHGLVQTLNGLLSELVFTLQAVADKKQAA